MDTLARTMRRAIKLLPDERAWDILKDAEYCVLSTTSEDGWPYGFPVSTILQGESLFFHCVTQVGHKLENFALDNRACLTAVEYIANDGPDYHYESAIAFGRVRLVVDQAERVRIFEAINERWDPLANDGSSVSSYPRTDVWAFDVEKLTAKWVNHKRRRA
jgi:nitroimidazol reductase NimA-like FMN-containing flavoprotein (pyridoxamine 5'-phosphate oxidase superfamily)